MKILRPLLSSLLMTGSVLASHSEGRMATIAVFTLNDFHAGIVQDLRKDIPGAPWVVQTLDSLKACYPYHITLSAGDNFGGSLYYAATRGESIMPQVFQDMDIHLSVPGNHAFDDGQEAFARKWSDSGYCPRHWDFRYVCANMRRDGRIPEWVQPWAVVPVAVGPADTVRVSVTGLLTANTPYQASARKLEGLSFDARYDAVLDSLTRLPGYAEEVAAADVHILATHITAFELNGRPVFDDPGQEALYALDRDDVDAIIAAHSHSLLAGTIGCGRPYPIVQALWHGIYVGMLLCEVDLDAHRCLRVTPHVVKVNPHAPLGVKAARLKAQIDEQYQTTLFHGHPLAEVLTTTPADIPHDRTVKNVETGVGRLVAEAYAEACRQAMRAAAQEPTDIVVGVSHFGSIRAGFYAGDITVGDVGEALPFANPLRFYRYTGRQLKALLDYGINRCPLGRIQTNGLRIVQDHRGAIRRIFARNAAGREVEIADRTLLTLSTDDYITTGGDGYDPAFFPPQDAIRLESPKSTDAFIAYLKGCNLQ